MLLHPTPLRHALCVPFELTQSQGGHGDRAAAADPELLLLDLLRLRPPLSAGVL